MYGHGIAHFGHGSGIALVIFGFLIVMRVLSSRRRRRGQERTPVSRNSFPGASLQGPAVASTVASQGTDRTTSTGVAPGWLADPFARHEQRYWSGTQWTEHVADGGVPGTDPPWQGTGK